MPDEKLEFYEYVLVETTRRNPGLRWIELRHILEQIKNEERFWYNTCVNVLRKGCISGFEQRWFAVEREGKCASRSFKWGALCLLKQNHEGKHQSGFEGDRWA